MVRLLSAPVLPSLLLLCISITLGHAKPHKSQGTEDGSLASIDNLARIHGVVMGDMLVPQSLYQWYFNPSKTTRKGISLEDYLWPREEGVPTVPYEFADVKYKSDIEAGLRHWEDHTCLTFRPKTSTDTYWLTFIRGDGCFSYAGKQAASQPVSIGDGCQWLGTVVHEVGHAIGLFHEQMRSDRDDYVVIMEDNFETDYKDNFIKASPGTENNRSVPYDYTSIMHYGGRDFSKNGKNTIATKQPEHQGLLGQAEELTHRDKHIVNIMYECIDQWQASCPSAVTCEGEGYLGRDCTCVCPPGREGDRCEVYRADYYADFLPACSKTITTESNFTSPNYPGIIPQGTWCVYTVEAPVGYVPEVVFHSFSFYSSSMCAYDFLQVRDSNIYDGDVFCGKDIKTGQSFVGTSRTLFLYLDTITSSSLGFQAEVIFHNASNPPSPRPGGASGLSPSTLAVLVALLASLIFQRV